MQKITINNIDKNNLQTTQNKQEKNSKKNKSYLLNNFSKLILRVWGRINTLLRK